MRQELNETQTEINRWIERLDQFVIGKEAVWGIGNLHQFCSAATTEKMNRQDKKLANAITRQDIKAVQNLVNGTMRGYEVMETEAKANGHKPITPECLEVKLDSGFTLRIARTVTEARSLTEDGVYVWSLHEVARVIEKDYTLVNKVKDAFPGAEVKEVTEFDFAQGDELPGR